MPRCTVGTADPPEEPPLCTEEAMCEAEKEASGTAGLAGDVSAVSASVGARQDDGRADDRLRATDGTDEQFAR